MEFSHITKDSCIAPWHAITVFPNGRIVPDNQNPTSYGAAANRTLKNSTLLELWNSPEATALRKEWLAGSWPESCRQCMHKEQGVGHSRRRFFRDLFVGTDIDMQSDSRIPDIRYLEIMASNVCNLKCVMCDGKTSTGWIKDEISLQNFAHSYERPPVARVAYHLMPDQILKNLFSDVQHFKNLQFVALRGGEPLMESMNLNICQWLIDSNLAKNITLDISTNATITNAQLEKAFSKFKTVRLHISVEAINDLYSYIRGGENFTFADLEKQIRRYSRFENYDVWLVTLSMVYNLWQLSDLFDWTTSIPNTKTTFKNMVVNPRYLNPHILPEAVRKGALQDKYREQGRDSGYNQTISQLLLTNLDYQQQRLCIDELTKYTRDLDQIRGTDISMVAPELSAFLKLDRSKGYSI